MNELQGWSTTVAVVTLLGVLLGGAVPHATTVSPPSVVAVYQSPSNITEQSPFTVHLQVSDSSNIQQVYFTFCQLSSPLCYLPIVMVDQGANWFAGTTNPMTAYPGMDVGVRAGYNITIVLNDNSTLNEPSVPSTFSNLTVTQSVTGEYMFEMTVSDHVYALSGTVYNASTGTVVPGATVTLSPGTHGPVVTNASGGYAFSGLSNGTYTVAATGSGFEPFSETLAITGQDVVKDVQLSHDAGPTDHGGTPSQGTGNFFTSPAGLGALGLVAVVVAIVALFGYSRLRKDKGGRAPPPQGADDSAVPPTSGGGEAT